jgi:6-phosphogluconolactonase
MKKIFTIILCVIAVIHLNAQSSENYLLVGTYTSSGKSNGIYVLKFNSKTGEAILVDSAITNNPSFISVSPNEKFVYAVHEVERNGQGGEISAFTFNKKKGALGLINKEPSGGDHPCYVQVDKTGKWIFVANYTSGSLSVLPVTANGGLGKATTVIQQTGSGPNKERQDKPHVHCTMISPDNKWLFVSDLGTDKVMIYSFNAKTGTLIPAKQPFYAAEPGAGPRHFTFHPNKKYAYLVEEMGGHVVAFDYKNGQLTEVQRIATTPEGQAGFPGSADIHVSPDGRFLYASNRGDFNTIVYYHIDETTGKLSGPGYQSALGKVPRNFNFDPTGNFLLAANQGSDEIVIFKRDKETGALTDTGQRISVGMPVCIKWIGIK